mgnify:CR=1 FL=1
MQGYAVRCTDMSDYLPCTESIIESRHDGPQLQPLTRARRNMADWMKLLSQTLLFNVSGDGNTIALSTYSIKERKAVDYVCSRLSDRPPSGSTRMITSSRTGSIFTVITITVSSMSLRKANKGGLNHATRIHDI